MSLPSRPRPVVLVTGASAGIGAALARIYAREGWDLILTARREAPLHALADELARLGAASTILTDDLADPAAPRRLFDAIQTRGLTVDGLINNAGFSRTAGFLNTDPAAHRAMIQVMLAAPVELARLFAPAMAERGFGRILNVASLAGQMPATGGDTLYGPIKSFLIKASQGLHLELRGTGVHVTALCPGYTLTEFHDVNGTRETTRKSTPDWLWMGADEVAEAGLEALEANRPVCVPGAPNKTIAALARLMPEDWALALMESQGSRFRKT
jgi:short-subunit dehydrogenase